jgi:glycosyltransferase involved in cell wall biosynthesis
MSQSDELAIYLPDGQIAPPLNPYGRLIANAGVYRALARYGDFRHVHIQSRGRPDRDQLTEELSLGSEVAVSTGPLLGTRAATRAGILLSGQPYLEEPAWIRRHAGSDHAYSIVGTIFAFASATHRDLMMRSALAPLQEWDAMICSSPSLARTVADTFDNWQDYLGERLACATVPTTPASASGATLRLPRPRLPVIPFGTDTEVVRTQASDGQARSTLRTSLGIAEDDVLLLFLGRLSYYDKAFPQAMFKAVQAAQQDSGATTHFVLTGWFPGGDEDRSRFVEAARSYAPQVTTSFLDGNDPQVVAQSWAAADVFLLLSDTILETFGQALVEAMAAGLPLVVSDWDGYRSIVRDGVDGFLVPTLGAPGGPLGETLALLQSVGQVGYPQYAGAVAQHTAVSVPRAAAALSRLLRSRDLRLTMGEAAASRAREQFDWQVVTAQYLELFAELAERRGRADADHQVRSTSRHRLNPLRSDPFVDFRALPSAVLTDDTIVWLTRSGEDPGPTSADLSAELDQLFPGLRGSATEADLVIDMLRASGPRPVADLVALFPPRRRPYVRMTVLWLAKAGVVEWLSDGD